ncbi:MAG: TIGR01459 family HAD-type hydrolase [Methylobacteriaceae bacterium]|jgi:HAD superfamily hydrolase (TIGR01459 family)|nr:TIGR01459 family HAD-type hydrolase [Methylobacteriaceae bacterium]
MSNSVRILSAFRDAAHRYPCVFADVWGVLHNGVRPYEFAVDMLAEYRAGGGVVVLITNSPRFWQAVAEQIDGIGVTRACWDRMATSGDLAQRQLTLRAGQKMYHIGTDMAGVYFRTAHPREAPLAEADFVYCTGLRDDLTEMVQDYRAELEAIRARDLPFICANPDLVVERGERLVECAGSLALAYEQMGGDVFWAGKPHPPIYELARELAEEAAGRRFEKKDILAVGDAIRTDIAGAVNFGVDSLMVTTGIHSGVFRGRAQAYVDAWFARQAFQPTWLLPF